MRTWLRKQITRLEDLTHHPDPDLDDFEYCSEVIREAADRAAGEGNTDFYREPRFAHAMEPRDALAILRSLLHAISAGDEPEYLTVDQAAARPQVSRDTIYDQINNGSLKHTKVGRIIRIRLADLDHIQSQDDGW